MIVLKDLYSRFITTKENSMKQKKVTLILENTAYDRLSYEVSYSTEKELDELVDMHEEANPNYSVINIIDGWESEDEDY